MIYQLVILLFGTALGGSVSIQTSGTLSVNNRFVLTCVISTFSGPATWSKGNGLTATCTSAGFCDKSSLYNYIFSSNINGMILTFNPLLQTDLGTTWTCFNDGTASYTISLASASDEGLSGGSIAGIVIGTWIGAGIFGSIVAAIVLCIRNK